MDSNLEAFNHDPTDDGIEALIWQSAALTTCLNEVFLSYWLRLPLKCKFIKRVKLTCLTTV